MAAGIHMVAHFDVQSVDTVELCHTQDAEMAQAGHPDIVEEGQKDAEHTLDG